MAEEWIAIAVCSKSLIILGAPGKYCSTIINMSVDNNKYVGIFGTGDLEFPEVAFKLDVAKGDEELRVILVEDLVGDASTVDTLEDLHVGIAIGMTEIWGKTAKGFDREIALKEGGRNIISLELQLVTESALDSSSKDCINSEQEEMMVTSRGISSIRINR